LKPLSLTRPTAIDDFMTVPRSRRGWREPRPVARTSRPEHPPPRRQHRELRSRDSRCCGFGRSVRWPQLWYATREAQVR